MQFKAIQGNSRQFKAIQGNSRQFKAIQGNTRQYKAMGVIILPVVIVSFKTSHQFLYCYQDNRTKVSIYLSIYHITTAKHISNIEAYTRYYKEVIK